MMDEEEVVEVEEEEGEEEDEDEEEAQAGPGEGEEEDGSMARLCRLMSNAVFSGFDEHVAELTTARARRREVLAFKSAIEDNVAMAAVDEGTGTKTQDELDGLGVWHADDQYQGDVNMRTLKKLLARIDARGFERCVQRART